jgi:hypothetical protein
MSASIAPEATSAELAFSAGLKRSAAGTPALLHTRVCALGWAGPVSDVVVRMRAASLTAQGGSRNHEAVYILARGPDSCTAAEPISARSSSPARLDGTGECA